MTQKYKMAVFDVDGTLVDSVEAIANGILSANQEMGLKPISFDTAKSVIGLGFADVVPIVAPELNPEHYQEYIQIYVRYFLQSDPYLKLFPNVLEFLETLHAAGIKVAVATGKSRKGLDRIFNRMGIWNYFDDSITSDEGKPKPNPRMLEILLERNNLLPEQAVMIGDTDHDIKFGKAARVDTVAVTWGAAPEEVLVKHAPTRLVHSLDELAASFGVSFLPQAHRK